MGAKCSGYCGENKKLENQELSRTIGGLKEKLLLDENRLK